MKNTQKKAPDAKVTDTCDNGSCESGSCENSNLSRKDRGRLALYFTAAAVAAGAMAVLAQKIFDKGPENAVPANDDKMEMVATSQKTAMLGDAFDFMAAKSIGQQTYPVLSDVNLAPGDSAQLIGVALKLDAEFATALTDYYTNAGLLPQVLAAFTAEERQQQSDIVDELMTATEMVDMCYAMLKNTDISLNAILRVGDLQEIVDQIPAQHRFSAEEIALLDKCGLHTVATVVENYMQTVAPAPASKRSSLNTPKP